MNYLSNSNIKNKNVILRCDFNVSVKNDVILDDSKIVKSLETIQYLLDNDNRVIILSHFGRVKKEEDKSSNSLRIVFNKLKEYVDVTFIEDPLKLDIINYSSNKCFLVENTRYTDIPNKKESANDLELAKYWASFGDVFVIDAFASLHRVHSSTAGISNYLPTYMGFLAEKEITNLNVLCDNNLQKFLVIMGGAKVDDKIKIIESIVKRCDKLLLTGGILNTFLKVSGKSIGKSLASNDDKVIEIVENVLKIFKYKIYFSDNFIVLRDGKAINVKIDEIKDEDIIYDNIIDVDNLLEDTKIVFLNGTCGKYEDEEYEKGTKYLLEKLNGKNIDVYIGGGDTISSVIKFGYKDAFTYLSSGGGATLEYVGYGKLNALEYIRKNSINN